MNAHWNLPPGCTPQDIDDAMGPDQCEHCDGTGKVDGEGLDACGAATQKDCPECEGTGNAPTRAELRTQREEERADLERDLRKDEE